MTSRFSPWRNSSGFTCVSFQRVLPSLAQVRACRFCDARLPRGSGSRAARPGRGARGRGGDAPAGYGRHHTSDGTDYQPRGRAMNDRTEEIRSTRAPKLREDQIEDLRRYGKTRRTEVGEVMIRAGERMSADNGRLAREVA